MEFGYIKDIIFEILKVSIKVIIYVTSGLNSWIIRFILVAFWWEKFKEIKYKNLCIAFRLFMGVYK